MSPPISKCILFFLDYLAAIKINICCVFYRLTCLFCIYYLSISLRINLFNFCSSKLRLYRIFRGSKSRICIWFVNFVWINLLIRSRYFSDIFFVLAGFVMIGRNNFFEIRSIRFRYVFLAFLNVWVCFFFNKKCVGMLSMCFDLLN